MHRLKEMSEDQLMVCVADLLAGRSLVLSNDELLQLADINEEFMRREEMMKDPIQLMEYVGTQYKLEPEGRGILERASHYLIFEKGKALYGVGEYFKF